MQSANDALNLASEEILNQCQNDRDETDVPNTISAWIRRNTLDPMIHQGVFRYLRAQELLSHGFGIESIVAFDCTLQSVGNFLHLRRALSAGLTRREVCEALNLPTEAADLAEYVYFLRNNFGAHAGGWRWWDHEELLEDEDLTRISSLVGIVLGAAADSEQSVRAIDPCPGDWAEWFFRNFEMLWDAKS
jgi:hypothetical protein